MPRAALPQASQAEAAVQDGMAPGADTQPSGGTGEAVQQTEAVAAPVGGEQPALTTQHRGATRCICGATQR